LDIFLRGFSLSSCPEHSLKVLLLLNPSCLLKYVLNCEENISNFILTVTGLARADCILLAVLTRPAGAPVSKQARSKF
jgi:hypothetical protein